MYRFTSMVIISTLALTCVAYAGPTPDSPPQVVVRFADLDLSRSQGAAALYRRLRLAAETVCAPDARDLGRHVRFKACVQSALSRAVAEVDRPALTEYFAARASAFDCDREAAQVLRAGLSQQAICR